MQLNEINKLNFDSWFDLWHTHFDWNGDDDSSRESRLHNISSMLQIFEALKDRLREKKSNDEYQVFCYISLEDPSQDAVYIHTKNPNHSNFPLLYNHREQSRDVSKELLNFLSETKYEWFVDIFDGAQSIILYDKGYGVSLLKIT